MKTDNKKTISAFTQDALGDHDAVALANQLRSGETTSTKLVQAALNRLSKVERHITATVCLRAEKALETAAQLDKRGKLKNFEGIPAFLKDNIDWVGVPTRHGSRATPAKPARRSGAVAQQFESMGVVLLGKSKLPEFGLTATTEYGEDAPARNPWNVKYSTGGSSGGSAALVAAGVVPIAHANDGGGSIRIPAACCGLVGLKLSRGRLAPNEMAKTLPINIVSDGVVTRSVRDTAAFVAHAEALYSNKRLRTIGHIQSPSTQRLRIGFFTDKTNGQKADKDCVKAVESAATLCKALGHDVREIRVPIDAQFADDFLLYWGMLAASLHRLGRVVIGSGFDASKLENLTYGLSGHFTRNLYKFPFAMRRLKNFQKFYEESLEKEGLDVLLSPTLGQTVPAIGHLDLNLPFDEARERLINFASFTAAQNVSGAPAISLPMHHTRQGLPVGVHFATGMGQEARLLQLALEIEEAQPFKMLYSLQAPTNA